MPLELAITRFVFVAIVLGNFGAKAATTSNDFRQLTASEKESQLFGDELLEEDWDLDEVPDSKIAMDLSAIIDHAVNRANTDEVDNEVGSHTGNVAIGPVYASSVSLFRTSDESIVIIGIYLVQDGGYYSGDQDLESHYFNTVEEAKAAGVDVKADVCWSGYSYYEWNGTSWTPFVNYDWEGRGLNWCGW